MLAVPVGTVIHQATFRVRRMCSWPLLQAPDTVCGVHSAVELTGSGLVLGHFSGTSPCHCLCSFCVRPAPARTLSVARSIYLRLPANARLWQAQRKFVAVEAPRLRSVLGTEW